MRGAGVPGGQLFAAGSIVSLQFLARRYKVDLPGVKDSPLASLSLPLKAAPMVEESVAGSITARRLVRMREKSTARKMDIARELPAWVKTHQDIESATKGYSKVVTTRVIGKAMQRATGQPLPTEKHHRAMEGDFYSKLLPFSLDARAVADTLVAARAVAKGIRLAEGSTGKVQPSARVANHVSEVAASYSGSTPQSVRTGIASYRADSGAIPVSMAFGSAARPSPVRKGFVYSSRGIMPAAMEVREVDVRRALAREMAVRAIAASIRKVEMRTTAKESSKRAIAIAFTKVEQAEVRSFAAMLARRVISAGGSKSGVLAPPHQAVRR